MRDGDEVLLPVEAKARVWGPPVAFPMLILAIIASLWTVVITHDPDPDPDPEPMCPEQRQTDQRVFYDPWLLDPPPPAGGDPREPRLCDRLLTDLATRTSWELYWLESGLPIPMATAPLSGVPPPQIHITPLSPGLTQIDLCFRWWNVTNATEPWAGPLPSSLLSELCPAANATEHPQPTSVLSIVCSHTPLHTNATAADELAWYDNSSLRGDWRSHWEWARLCTPDGPVTSQAQPGGPYCHHAIRPLGGGGSELPPATAAALNATQVLGNQSAFPSVPWPEAPSIDFFYTTQPRSLSLATERGLVGLVFPWLEPWAWVVLGSKYALEDVALCQQECNWAATAVCRLVSLEHQREPYQYWVCAEHPPMNDNTTTPPWIIGCADLEQEQEVQIHIKCSEYALCDPMLGMCICEPGFNGNGFVCEPCAEDPGPRGSPSPCPCTSPSTSVSTSPSTSASASANPSASSSASAVSPSPSPCDPSETPFLQT